MQHVVDIASAIDATRIALQQPAAMVAQNNSQSTASSPGSAKMSTENNITQMSETTLSSSKAHELTPPSSIASIKEQHDVDRQLTEEKSSRDTASAVTTGKKRTANGQVKEADGLEHVDGVSEIGIHINIPNPVSERSNSNLTDLSQQLRTRLTYAMVKVQNGWQKHSIDEVESLASQSPRSALSAAIPRDRRHTLSPRTSLAFHKQMNGGDLVDYRNSPAKNTSQKSDMVSTSITDQLPNASASISPIRKLAPPASITPGLRRRPAPNVSLQINSSFNPSPRSSRPVATQRTPSQNAAMEADAVETLMFMSASPNNSGHFPSHISTYSPTSQVFSAQTSPLKSQFPTNVTSYSPPTSIQRKRHEEKADLIDRLLDNLDDDENEELDRAMKIMERHQAAKLSA